MMGGYGALTALADESSRDRSLHVGHVLMCRAYEAF